MDDGTIAVLPCFVLHRLKYFKYLQLAALRVNDSRKLQEVEIVALEMVI